VDIGRRIARYRTLNGWSARQLAQNTDGVLSRDTIANIENGRRDDLTLRQFLSIALALRVPPIALLIDLEHPFAPSAIRFPGPAPAPLEPTAPQIALATWMSIPGDNSTTTAGRWVAEVTALLADYVEANDAAAIHEARRRLASTPEPGPADDPASRRRRTRTALSSLGIDVPDES
jgi:transcriptional regulator with XRE-family HTH domain